MNEQHPSFRGTRHNARSLALQVLLDCLPNELGRQERFIQEVLDQHLASEACRDLSAPDRRLATHLSYGVLRRRGTLIALLRPLITREPDKVEPWLWETLLLGAYQLALLTQIPPHAALNETVELASQFGLPRAKGFINGVLRAFLRLLTPDRVETAAADALPLEGGVYRRLARAVLPPPDAAPVEYLARGFGLPRWLAARWVDRLGEKEAFRLGFWFAGPGPLILRVQPLKTTRENLVQALIDAGWHATPGEDPQAIRLREHAPVRELPGFDLGWFSVQDESAMRVARALNPQPGSRVLDLCAAPGGKTTHLAEIMQDRGSILACDVEERRLRTVQELARRLSLNCIATLPLDPVHMDALPPGPFDAALVDVPCSNTGVLGRRPEARWRLRPGDFPHLVSLQERLLRLASERVRDGGVIVYSTCSIEPEENGLLVRRMMPALGLELEQECESAPGRPADGGYWARLRKVGPQAGVGEPGT